MLREAYAPDEDAPGRAALTEEGCKEPVPSVLHRRSGVPIFSYGGLEFQMTLVQGCQSLKASLGLHTLTGMLNLLVCTYLLKQQERGKLFPLLKVLEQAFF